MQGQTKTWDIAGDAFDSFEDVGEIEIATLSLDEPELEAIVFTDDGDGGDGSDDEAIEVGSNDRWNGAIEFSGWTIFVYVKMFNVVAKLVVDDILNVWCQIVVFFFINEWWSNENVMDA